MAIAAGPAAPTVRKSGIRYLRCHCCSPPSLGPRGRGALESADVRLTAHTVDVPNNGGVFPKAGNRV
jgi:hypothetical protein